MNNFGLNLSMRDIPETILEVGEKCLATGLFKAIEVTYSDNLMGVDSSDYNDAIKTLVKKYSPQVLVHIMGFNTSEECISLRSAIIHEFINCCRYVKSLGGNEIIMHSGYIGFGSHSPIEIPQSAHPTREQQYARAFDLSVNMFKICSNIAREYGIHIYTENLNSETVTETAEQLVAFVNAIGEDNVSIIYDVGHAHYCGLNIVESVKTCGKLLQHTHIHDNRGNTDSHLAVGEADIDFKSFYKALKDIDYTGLYLFEVFPSTADNFLLSLERSKECLASL